MPEKWLPRVWTDGAQQTLHYSTESWITPSKLKATAITLTVYRTLFFNLHIISHTHAHTDNCNTDIIVVKAPAFGTTQHCTHSSDSTRDAQGDVMNPTPKSSTVLLLAPILHYYNIVYTVSLKCWFCLKHRVSQHLTLEVKFKHLLFLTFYLFFYFLWFFMASKTPMTHSGQRKTNKPRGTFFSPPKVIDNDLSLPILWLDFGT